MEGNGISCSSWNEWLASSEWWSWNDGGIIFRAMPLLLIRILIYTASIQFHFLNIIFTILLKIDIDKILQISFWNKLWFFSFAIFDFWISKPSVVNIGPSDPKFEQVQKQFQKMIFSIIMGPPGPPDFEQVQN